MLNQMGHLNILIIITYFPYFHITTLTTRAQITFVIL